GAAGAGASVWHGLLLGGHERVPGNLRAGRGLANHGEAPAAQSLRAAARTWQESPRASNVSTRGPPILEDPLHKTLLLSINALCASIVWAQAPASLPAPS